MRQVCALQLGRRGALDNWCARHIICETHSQTSAVLDNRTGEMKVFRRAVEAGSFSEAARLLRMTPSTVSKLIGRIERRMGVRLLERSTRRLSLTAEGRIYYERGAALLADLDDLERTVAQGAAATRGTVRVNMSVAFATVMLEPLLPAFWQAYPNITIDLSISDEVVDLYLDRTDVAFRVGPLQDSSVTARRVGVTRRRVVAAPRYLEQHGVPRTIANLAVHNCLGFNFRRSSPVWPVRETGRPGDETTGGGLVANNGETLRRMAVAGLGLVRLADFQTRADRAAGRLVEVLSEAIPPEDEAIHALYLGGPRVPQRVRVFLDFTIPRLQRELT